MARRPGALTLEFQFDGHTLDTDRRELYRGTQRVAVEPQVFDLLVYLFENRERVVSKDDLIASVWGGRIVSDSTLTSRINAARKAIGDSGEDQIEADNEDPWAHFALGGVYLFMRRFDDSLAEFEWALRLNPNFSLAQGYYGLTLSYCGRWQDGDLAARGALRLSPRDPFSAIYCGINSYAQFVGRNYHEAMRLAREGIRQRADFVGAHRVFTASAGMAGLRTVASDALQDLRRAQPNISLAWIARQMPIRDDSDREHYLEGFRRAGLE
jgi:tetratricopeptide (TPR) repeat protein